MADSIADLLRELDTVEGAGGSSGSISDLFASRPFQGAVADAGAASAPAASAPRSIYDMTQEEALEYLRGLEGIQNIGTITAHGGTHEFDPLAYLDASGRNVGVYGGSPGGYAPLGEAGYMEIPRDPNYVEGGMYTRAVTPMFDPNYAGGVYGQYEGIYDKDGNLKDVQFRKGERHEGFLSENLDWIGPLVVGGAMGLGGGLFGGLGGGTGAGISPGVMAGLETGLAGGAGAGGAGISAGTMAGLETGLGLSGEVAADVLLGSTTGDALLGEGVASGLGGISEGTMAGLEAGLGSGISEGTMAGLETGLTTGAVDTAGYGAATADSVGKTAFDKATAAYKAASPFVSAAKALFGGSSGSGSGSGSGMGGLAGMGGVLGLALLLGQLNRDRNAQPAGATPVVPLRRSKVTQRPFTMGKPPLGYFGERVYYADGGGVMGLARGGSSESRAIRGPGDGTSDSIPARINGHEPAALADGEFVIDARTVAELGNGSTEAGVEKLEAMVKRVHAVRAKAKRGEDGNADKHLPA